LKKTRVFLRKTSLVDYPGKVAAAVFLPGCNLRCPWCHNRELVAGGGAGLTGLDEALSLVAKRRGVLGGVVLSGGEPSLYGELPGLIREIRGMGLKVKLDTNGLCPSMLETLFLSETARPDYIALDLKLAPGRYGELAPPAGENAANPGCPDRASGLGEALKQSAALINGSGIAHEYRTLVLPEGYISAECVGELAALADNAPWFFRPFMPGNCLDPGWNAYDAPGAETVTATADIARRLGKNALCP
jgi:pyruvate formate lyase activating enzyme